MGEAARERSPVAVVGMHGGAWFGRAAESALSEADLVIGARRHLDCVTWAGCERVELTTPVDAVLELAAARHATGGRVCVLGSGDPGFFGLVRLAAARFPVEVHPAPSSVSLAFARLGVNWDDAAVVSAHGRPVAAAVEKVLGHPKVAVLTSPDVPPEQIGGELFAAGCGPRRVAVCARLGEFDEEVARGDMEWLAQGRFDPRSVVVFEAPAAESHMGLAWGIDDDRFDHRDGMITKAEVRAVALGKLALPHAGVLWDVGAGSGSISIECARLAPGLRAFAVERRDDDLDRLRANTAGTGITVVAGEAPGALAGLPDPDRAFVGGGGLGLLDAVLGRLAKGGVVVATYAALDRAAAAAERLGNLVQISVSRGTRLGTDPDAPFRLAAENPVFVCWGPER